MEEELGDFTSASLDVIGSIVEANKCGAAVLEKISNRFAITYPAMAFDSGARGKAP